MATVYWHLEYDDYNRITISAKYDHATHRWKTFAKCEEVESFKIREPL